jgi:hypothetical protein
MGTTKDILISQKPSIKTKKSPLWYIKLTNYEYWPWWTLYLPALPIWLWNAMRSRSFTYFTAVNPGLKSGGFYGESKKEILDLIPNDYKPATLLINLKNPLFAQMQHLAFPLIAKPDIGERGNGVAKIQNLIELEVYHRNAAADYILQEYVDFKLELAILYSRMPGESKGKITSVTQKEFLSVVGNGVDTLEFLVNNNDRARFQTQKLQEKYETVWHSILPNGQKIELESIGNHCRGTRFINANYLINKELEQVFDNIADQILGFDYGRYDLRVRSLEDLYQGKNIRIVELNGVNADPAHIYDNSHGFWASLRDIARHWLRIGDIAKVNLDKGFKAVALNEIWEKFKSRNL